MKLVRLELFGFKSFLNRTVFNFSDGVTSIVGPNGCGKSNIVDAIIWALGERGTKSLRVKDMGDVIFHGSNGKKPVNIGEVTLELADDGKEYAVKRRIYRDGSNEYFLNGSLVRLKDIQDFLFGTGLGLNSYAIVEQGKIEYFIQMKPQERRVVVEETSGVTRFEEKKRDAIARLEEVKANLERVEDIHSEVGRSFEKAETEWNRWRGYRVLADSLHDIEMKILADGYVKLLKKVGRIEERQGDLDKDIVNREEALAALRDRHETKEKEFALTDSLLRQLELDIKGREKDMETRLLEMGYVKEEYERLRRSSEALIKHSEELESKIRTCKEEINAVETRKEEYARLLNEEEASRNLLSERVEELRKTIEGYEKRLEEERVKLFVAMSRLTEIRNRIAEAERLAREKQRREEKRRLEKEALDEKLALLAKKETGLKEALAAAQQEKGAIASEEAEALKEKDGLARAVEEKRRLLERLKGEKRGKEEFLKQMSGNREKGEGAIPGTKRLIDLIRSDEETEKALERFFFKEMEYYALLGGDLNTLVERVKEHDRNYIFFPAKGVFTLKGAEIEIDVKWVETMEEALRRIENGEEGIFINNDTYVDSRGIILREKDAGKVDLKQFRERKRVEKEIREIDVILNTHLASLQETEGLYKQFESGFGKTRERLRAKEEMIHRLEKEVIALAAEIRTAEERMQELERPVDLLEETPPLETDVFLKEKVEREKEKTVTEEKMTVLREELTAIKQDYENGRSQWHDLTIAVERKRNNLQALREEAQRKVALISSLTEEKEGNREKVEQLSKDGVDCLRKLEGIGKSYDELKKICEGQVERYEDLKKKTGDLHMERHTLKESMEGVEKEIEKIRNKKENNEKEIAVLLEKKDTIYERLQTIYHVLDPESIDVPSGAALESEREKLTKEISHMGEINFRAEKEYLELKERAAFLEVQKTDLKNSMDSLKKTIIKIDQISREIFLETFEAVNEAFKRFTRMLFKGGTGYLSFHQEIQGIEMFVQPPGKKVARMEQLSGGEKALISLAFLLSLIDTKPSPFSLMDEIDAPLDDANLTSLLDIIKVLAGKTQVVFVTHNRITMESSDTIYGITMEEEGISKVVSVRL